MEFQKWGSVGCARVCKDYIACDEQHAAENRLRVTKGSQSEMLYVRVLDRVRRAFSCRGPCLGILFAFRDEWENTCP